MAKFFPFIVEKSTPTYIFEAVLSRSKGMNNLTVASIFYLILDRGIDEVRKVASEFPDMNLENIYDNLLLHYQEHRISTDDFTRIMHLAPYVNSVTPDKLAKELSDYSAKDTMNFLLVTHLIGQADQYTQLPIENLFNGKAQEAESLLSGYDLFSSNGPELVFKSKEDLRAYVNFFTVIFPYPNGPVKAALINGEEDSSTTGQTFEQYYHQNGKTYSAENSAYRNYEDSNEEHKHEESQYDDAAEAARYTHEKLKSKKEYDFNKELMDKAAAMSRKHFLAQYEQEFGNPWEADTFWEGAQPKTFTKPTATDQPSSVPSVPPAFPPPAGKPKKKAYFKPDSYKEED